MLTCQCSTNTAIYKHVSGSYTVVKKEKFNDLSNDKILLTGLVSDGLTGNPLPYANITIVDANLGISCDSLGNFKLLAPAGNFRLRASNVGNDDLQTRKMKFKAQMQVTLDFRLGTTLITCQ